MRSIIILVGVLAVTPARAQSIAMVEPARALAWRAPAGCPDAASLRARIEQRLERSLDDVVIGVEVDVALSAGRYVARVDLRAVTVANDIRTLTSKRCSELADAVAVIVARVASEQIARRSVAVREESDAEAEKIVVAPPPPPPPPRPWTIGARISGVSGIGIIPQVGLGAEGAITLRRHDTMAEVAATRWLTSAAQFHDGAPAKVDVNLDVAAVRFGWRPVTLPLRAWLAAEGGSMRGTGITVPGQQLESGRWLAAGAGFGIAWQMTPWIRLLGTTETMLAVERVRFSLGDGVIVYAPSPMSFRTSCGLEIGWQ